MLNFFHTMFDFCLELSPWLLGGFLIAGVITVLLPNNFLQKHIGNNSFSSAIKATLIGIPLPICSCGIIPIIIGLREKGAGKPAITALLLSTPQTSIDSLMISWALLGPAITISVLISVITGGLLSSFLVAKFDNNDKDKTQKIKNNSNCCSTHKHAPKKKSKKITAILKAGLWDLPGKISIELILGIILATLVTILLPKDLFTNTITNPYLQIFALLLCALPIYFCTTASVPIAATFLQQGVSPGAVLVFLLAGPVTNAASISATIKIIGKKSTAIYLTVILICAIIAGITINLLFPKKSVLAEIEHHHHDHKLFATICVIIIFSILITQATKKIFSKKYKCS